MQYLPLAAAYTAALGAPTPGEQPAQLALELATVTGYGTRAHPAGGNEDTGNPWVIVAYWPQGGEWHPVVITLHCDGQGGGLGTVQVTCPVLAGAAPTLEQLAVSGLWPAPAE